MGLEALAFILLLAGLAVAASALAIVRGNALESEEGQGSTFSFAIPRERAA